MNAVILGGLFLYFGGNDQSDEPATTPATPEPTPTPTPNPVTMCLDTVHTTVLEDDIGTPTSSVILTYFRTS